MTKLKKITTVGIIIYSACIFVLPILFIVYSIYYLDSFLTFIFGEIVNVNIWKLNCYLLGFISLLSGTLGIISGVAIWKEKRGAERLWLIVISWQLIISFMQIGPYGIGSPDWLSISIVSCLCGWSWFVFWPPRFNDLFANSKRYLYEILLLFAIVSQVVSIGILNSQEDDVSINVSEGNIKAIINRGMGKALRADIYGKYYDKYFEFYERYEEKDSDGLRQSGKFLLKNGYEDDRMILGALAAESYSRGQSAETVTYLESALNGGYASEAVKPSENLINFEKAQLHYMLYLVHSEIGNTHDSQKEYNLSIDYFKKFYDVKYSDELLEKGMDMSKRALNHFRTIDE
jgi:tetratricopeptide (TPR) repeat protein